MAKTQPHRSDPDAERTKLRAIATARRLGGLANDTKWKKLIETCYAMDWRGPLYSCKCIDSDYVSTVDGEWHAIPFPPSAIEWLDVYYVESSQRGGLLPVEAIDHSCEIETALKRIGFDYKKRKESFRIFGYAPRNEDGFVGSDGAKPV